MNKRALLKYGRHPGLNQGPRSAVECSTTELYPLEYAHK